MSKLIILTLTEGDWMNEVDKELVVNNCIDISSYSNFFFDAILDPDHQEHTMFLYKSDNLEADRKDTCFLSKIDSSGQILEQMMQSIPETKGKVATIAKFSSSGKLVAVGFEGVAHSLLRE